MSFSATYNTTTNKVDVAWTLEPESCYIGWSDTATTDYSAILSSGNYTVVYTNTGTWSDTNALSAGSTRHYYALDIYDSSLLASASCTAPESITAPTDFIATAVNNTSVQCCFTLPTGLSENTQIEWQKTTTDPENTGAVWTTLATTDKTGTAIVE